MKLKKVQTICNWLLVAGLVFTALVVVIKSFMCVLLALGAMLAHAIFKLCYWRCPSCGSFLGKEMGPRHCKHCGEKLDI